MNYVISWQEAFHAFLSMIGFLICCFLSGNILIKRFIPGRLSSFKLFLSFVCGLIMIISLYAIWITKGKTVLLPIPLFLILGLLFIKRDIPSSQHGDEVRFRWQHYVISIVSFSVIYFFYYLQFYLGGDNRSFSYPGGDNLFYSRVIDYLNTYGIENNQADFFFPYDTGLTPYHYFDLWVGAFISNVFNVNSLNALVLCSYSVFCVFTASGVLALLDSIFKQTLHPWLMIGLSGLTTFFSGFAIFFPSYILKADVFSSSISNNPKLAFVSIFLALLIILARRSFWNTFLIFGVILSILFINVLPATIGACIVTSFLYIIALKEKPAKNIFPGIVVIVMGLSYLLIFYTVFGAKDETEPIAQTSYFDQILPLLSSKNLATSFKIFAGGTFQFFTLLPFILLLIWFFVPNANLSWAGVKATVKSTKQWVILIVFTLFGLASWAAAHSISTESVQFYQNIFIPCAGIFISIIIALCLSRDYFRITGFVLSFLMFAANLGNNFHRKTQNIEDWENLKSFIKNSNGLMVNVKGGRDFQTFFSKNTLVYQPQEVLYFLVPNYNNACLSVFDTPGDENPVNSSQIKRFISQSPLNKISKTISPEVSQSAADSQEILINRFNIKYASVSPNSTIPKYLKNIATDSITLSTSGWKIIKLGR